MSDTAIGINHADGNEASDCPVRFDFRVDFKSSDWIGKEVNEAAVVAVEVEADWRAELSLDSDVRIARSFTVAIVSSAIAARWSRWIRHSRRKSCAGISNIKALDSKCVISTINTGDVEEESVVDIRVVVGERALSVVSVKLLLKLDEPVQDDFSIQNKSWRNLTSITALNIDTIKWEVLLAQVIACCALVNVDASISSRICFETRETLAVESAESIGASGLIAANKRILGALINVTALDQFAGEDNGVEAGLALADERTISVLASGSN